MIISSRTSGDHAGVRIAIQKATTNGIVVVAAGNSGLNTGIVAQFPSQYAEVICVAAVDKLDRIAAFTNFGPTRRRSAAPPIRGMRGRACPGGSCRRGFSRSRRDRCTSAASGLTRCRAHTAVPRNRRRQAAAAVCLRQGVGVGHPAAAKAHLIVTRHDLVIMVIIN